MSAENSFLHFRLANLPDEGLTPAVKTYLENYGLLSVSMAASESVARHHVTFHWSHNDFARTSTLRIDSAITRKEEAA